MQPGDGGVVHRSVPGLVLHGPSSHPQANQSNHCEFHRKDGLADWLIETFEPGTKLEDWIISSVGYELAAQQGEGYSTRSRSKPTIYLSKPQT